MKYIYILFCVLNIVSCNTRNEYKESALNVYEQIINLNCNLDSLEFNILKRGSLYIFSNRDQSVFMKLDEDKVYIAEVRFVLEEFLLDSVCNSNKIDFCNLNKIDFIKLS